MRKNIIALLLVCILQIRLSAQEKSDDRQTPPEEEKRIDWGLGAHPIIGYDDEASLTLGGACVFYFEPADKSRDLDEIEVSATYNLARQYDLMLVYSKYFSNDCSFSGKFGYQNYPDDFRGEDYDAEYFPFEIEGSFRIMEKLYAGPVYDFQYSDTEFDDQEVIKYDMNGSGRNISSGLGGQLTWKNLPGGEIYRRDGTIFKISYVYYSPLFGSSSEFNTIDADCRFYFPVLDRCVLAFQLSGKTSRGDSPFYYMPELEGKGLLRGGSDQTGSYFIASQSEFRFPVVWRISAAVFAGAGEVEDSIGVFGKDICVAGGAGLRIALNKKKTINLRFDLAFNNRGESSKYIKIKEAF